MDEFNRFVASVGLDKLAHHFAGAMICAFITIVLMFQEGAPVGWRLMLYAVAGTVGAAVVMLLKEMVDERPDWRDFTWGTAGSLWIVVAMAIGIALNLLSH